MIAMMDDVLLVKDAVQHVLDRNRQARNDDRLLIIETLKEMGIILKIEINGDKKMPAFESITRCRRRYQQQGLYPAAPEIKEQRDVEEQKMRNLDDWFEVGK